MAFKEHSIGRGIVFGLGGITIWIALFTIYSFFAWQTYTYQPLRFNSPDETANYFFSRQFAHTGQFAYTEPLLTPSKGFIHPRSMTVAGDSVVPVGFIGLPFLFGLLARIFGDGAIPFFTPALAACTPFFFFLALKSFFSRRIALLSSALLAVHPAFWYYAERSLMPNILFCTLIIGGCALFFTARSRSARRIDQTHTWWQSVCAVLLSRNTAVLAAGLCMGFSLAVRFSEALWVVPLVACMVFFSVRQLGFRMIPLFSLGFCIGLGILFFENYKIYGSPLIFGYQTLDLVPSAVRLEQSLSIIHSLAWGRIGELWSNGVTIIQSFSRYILPFGFLPHVFKLQFAQYAIALFWWFSIPVAVGCVLMIREGIIVAQKKKMLGFPLLYCLLFFLVSLWLGIYYGSWTVVDNIAGEVTIGNAYIRYWLPLFIFSIPCAALGLALMVERRSNAIRLFLSIGALTLIIFYSAHITLWQSPDSILPMRTRIAEYHSIVGRIKEITPEDAVIFSPRSDKIFFPERKVAQVFDTFREVPLLPEIVRVSPVYYYGFWEPALAEAVSRKFFLPHNLKLVYVEKITGNEYLYRVEVQ